MIDRSKLLYAKTEGAFDPTVGPLVNLWGFGPEGESTIPLTELVAVTAADRFPQHQTGVRSGWTFERKGA